MTLVRDMPKARQNVECRISCNASSSTAPLVVNNSSTFRHEVLLSRSFVANGARVLVSNFTYNFRDYQPLVVFLTRQANLPKVAKAPQMPMVYGRIADCRKPHAATSETPSAHEGGERGHGAMMMMMKRAEFVLERASGKIRLGMLACSGTMKLSDTTASVVMLILSENCTRAPETNTYGRMCECLTEAHGPRLDLRADVGCQLVDVDSKEAVTWAAFAVHHSPSQPPESDSCMQVRTIILRRNICSCVDVNGVGSLPGLSELEFKSTQRIAAESLEHLSS
ncbi:hypothetical protein B0T17DRAFT_504078 [Bombardia bombarda]|uniref:Uncharacterized protein n=1 Tax=Bombardia bombarda TaxID=252184 RepID=A0AA40CFJ8_9PEZI|nr:hypothetical protein B0T17DRAFT_504078 [Bombardia bombarda]